MTKFLKSYVWVPGLIGILVYFQSIWYESAWGDDQLTISPISKDFSLMLKNFYDNSSVPGLHFCPLYFFQCYLINFIFGKNAFPLGFHLYSIILHAISCILATVIFYKITRNKIVSIIAISLWTVHPLNVEIITRLGCGPAQLASGTFCLAFMFCVLKIKEVKHITAKVGLIIFSILFFLFSMTTHEQYIFFPFVALLVCFYLEGKKIFQNRKYIIQLILPLVIIYPIYLVWRYFACGGTLYETSDELIKWTEVGSLKDILFRAFWLAPQLIVHYFRLFFFPDFLAESQADWFKVGGSVLNLYSIFCQVIITTILVSGVFLYKKVPLYSIGVFWFFITMIPVVQVVPLYVMIDEHYCYVSVIGIMLMVYSVLEKYLNKVKAWILVAIFGIIFGLLLWRTELYISTVKDKLTHLIYLAKEAPPWLKVQQIALALVQAKEENRINELPDWLTSRAIQEGFHTWLSMYLNMQPDLSLKYGPMQVSYNYAFYRSLLRYLCYNNAFKDVNILIDQSLKVKNNWFGFYQLSKFLLEIGYYEKAWHSLVKAINLNPQLKVPYSIDFIEIVKKTNKFNEAENIVKNYINIKPKSSHPYLFAGLFYKEFGKTKEALSCFKKGISKDKIVSINDTGLYFVAADLFIKSHRFNLARETFKIISSINPFDKRPRKMLLIVRNLEKKYNYQNKTKN
ncbi:MAG: tetratricopeptide repeat protein [Candidatus Melainabacteria bacterium]|nr:tetratricopeptide repeat protein [Candidatus Melainabacteria bacterium]